MNAVSALKYRLQAKLNQHLILSLLHVSEPRSLAFDLYLATLIFLSTIITHLARQWVLHVVQPRGHTDIEDFKNTFQMKSLYKSLIPLHFSVYVRRWWSFGKSTCHKSAAAFPHTQLHGLSSFRFLWLCDTLTKDSMCSFRVRFGLACGQSSKVDGQVLGIQRKIKESSLINCQNVVIAVWPVSSFYSFFTPPAPNHTCWSACLYSKVVSNSLFTVQKSEMYRD